jgi:LytS/YehU family sensor histidine kinase
MEYAVPFVTKKIKKNPLTILIAILFLFIYMMLCSYGLYGWSKLGMALSIYHPLKKYDSTVAALQNMMAYSAMAFFIFAIARHIYSYNKLKQDAQQLRIEKQDAELNFLKAQTNPHFLFNTLHNIYSLSLDKSDLAPKAILRLSKILRFMLYEINSDYISIDQEIKIINDYIELEKLRYDESLRVIFTCDIEDEKQALPPLLLMPLVENAFKHGVSETRTNPFVDIHLLVKKRNLELTVKNSAAASPDEKPAKENIGLSNLRRQLELLYTDYQVNLHHTEFDFTAMLKINLSSHV